MLGYLRDARTGAAIHNLGHTCLAPLALLALGWAAALPPVMTVALTGLLTSAWTGRWATG